MKKIYVNENKLHLLNEGLYDNFSVEDADIIYYNKYQENWGDDEEEDMKDVYNILIYDMDGNQIYEEDGLLSYELDDLLGEDISYKICNNEGEINRNQQLKQYYPYCLSDFNSHTFGDINETAKKLFKNQLCDYFPNLHGYIMQDGTCINLGYDDHNTICKIPQINDKWEFIALGNIRCSESFFDLIQEPTYQQKLALRKLIANSNDLSVDIFSEDSDSPLTSAIYNGNPEPSYVLGEISRFFDEGIKLQGGYGMYESKNIKGKQLNEFFYRENQSNADNVIVKDLNLHLWWEDSGAYPFGWFDDVLYIGDESTMHSSPTLKALHDEINNRILNDGCEAIIDGTFNDEVDGYSKYKFLEHPDDVEYREENESEEDKEDFYYEPYFNEYNYLINDNITYNHTSDELDYKLQEMDISGRYWVYDKVISFWSSMDSEMMDKCIKDLIKHTNIDFYEFMYVYEDYDNNEIKYCTVREFINSENDIEFKADDRENKGIHLMKPKEKSEALMDFKRNRNDVNFKKLGKIPMAQYHNMIYQEGRIIESNSPDSMDYFGKKLSYEDNDAYAFIIVNNDNKLDVEMCENGGSTHFMLVRNLASKMIGFNSYSEFNDYLYDEALPQEFDDWKGELDNTINDIRKEIVYEGRYWCNEEIISFWDKTPPRLIIRDILDEISSKLSLMINKPKVSIGDYIIPYDEYNYTEIIKNDKFKLNTAKSDEELRNIHLMKQNDKRSALKDFRDNRSRVQSDKLGNITMAQYHNMIYQEDLENETEVLNENTFNNWFRKSVLVNDIGEPIKMYHGSNSEFDEFKKEYIGSFGAYEGYGFNFTPFRGRAESYNNSNVIEAYLRCENPMTSKSNKISINNLMSIIKELDYGKPYTDTIVAAYEQPTYREKWDKSYYRRALPVAANKIFEYNEYGDAGLYAEICLNGNGDKYKVIDLFERLGYDSVIFYDNDDRIKTVIVFEPNQIKKVTNTTFNDKSNIMSENFEFEVEPNDVDLSSFKMKETLNVDIWDNFETINSKVRLKLLDIADDFYNSLEINYIKPIDIVLTGSICNFNWSKFSDIDLHIVIDFNEISEKHEMVQEYLDAKKNEWNNQHEDLTIYGFNVELYVQNSHDFDVVDGTYSLEKNKWLKKPIREKLRPIDERKHKIQVVASDIMTKIDDMEEMFEKCDDKHKLEVLSNKIDKMLFNLKTIRKNGLNSKSAEMSIGNIIYKILRRTDYFDKLWHLKIKLYDKINSIF